MRGSFQFLGTGASAGIPVIGCKCAVCLSNSERNKRFRPSGLIRAGGKTILIDVGPDFRSQALRFGIDHLDGVLLTHTHYDHIAGIDEMRIFNVRQKKALSCLLSQESFDEIGKRYYYFFLQGKQSHSAQFDFQILENEMGTSEFLGLSVGYCSFSQGDMKITGFRIGDFAYISDIRKYDDSIFTSLHGVKKLVISALKPEASTFHFSFDEAALFSKRIGAEQTWLTHLGHFVDHDMGNTLLPAGIKMGYDGLTMEFECTN